MRWFQLDSDMPHDPRIRAIVRDMGPAGLGGLTCLWCHVARWGAIPGRAIDTAGEPFPIDDLREASLLDAATFDRLLLQCLALGHFSIEAWRAAREIRIPAMERRGAMYAPRYAKKGDAPPKI